MTEIELTKSTLIIHMKGFTKINATLNRVQLKIPLAHVVGAEIGATVTEKLGPVGLMKLSPPDFVPTEPFFEKKYGWTLEKHGVAGGFTVEGQKIFYDGSKPRNAITIKLANERYAMLVFKVADPAAAVARIEKAVQAHKS